ncbi:1-acylglycerol-3-phosphate O-acyltransferase PNPLA3 [Trichechus manatus latirostris]|uniref:1-acylglycerol-3-phosphate O-acyltransferase PNPLA3 n=1 Tax=Trichechus manatus latirostris TaxID=127582 RepID=A0A2Y9RA03_TRIMA|nr:1-acylglycerol-3-phosphate O-acyltransferase PNPLA3 [Trichechus manatus latirostris]
MARQAERRRAQKWQQECERQYGGSGEDGEENSQAQGATTSLFALLTAGSGHRPVPEAAPERVEVCRLEMAVVEAADRLCSYFPHSKRYMDGGVSDNVPFADDKTTITVSPFFGEHDICPKVKSSNFLHVNFSKLSLHLCLGNAYLLARAVLPGDPKVHGEICLRGYLDTVRFLEEKGICERPGPCLKLASEAVESETSASCWEDRSLEPPREAVALETKPEEDELLAHLRLSILPWDERILETVSSKLLTALREAIKEKRGCTSKICNFLPVRIISYLMLPCTLPVESAIAVVQKLLMWPPDIYDDLQWLLWVTSRVCYRVVTCLLPTSRSQAPASSQ